MSDRPSPEIQVQVAPKKGTYDWYRWIVERLGKRAAAKVAATVPDAEQKAVVHGVTYNETRRALIELLAEIGVFKRVQEIKIPKGGGPT